MSNNEINMTSSTERSKQKNKKLVSMRARRTAGNIVYNTLMILLCLIIIFPFIWTFTGAFKSNYQVFHESPLNLIPQPFTIENFQELYDVYESGVNTMVFNGLYLAIVIPIISLLVSSMAAFALARLRFKGSNVVFILLISTMMIPSYVTLIPNFAIMIKLGLYNSHWALIIRAAFSGSATAIFLFRQYFLTIPRDLENAAIIDGCSWPAVYFRIILPNSKPVLATTAILSFRSTWNAYLWPSLILTSESKWTWTLGLKILTESAMGAKQTVMLAGAVISILPILIIYIIFQKYFVNSQVSSGFAGT